MVRRADALSACILLAIKQILHYLLLSIQASIPDAHQILAIGLTIPFRVIAKVLACRRSDLNSSSAWIKISGRGDPDGITEDGSHVRQDGH
jgi:hypothetical protein